MLAITIKAMTVNFLPQKARIKNTNMAAGGIVVGLAQPPANTFRPGPGHADTEPATGLQHPVELIEHRDEIRNVFQHFTANRQWPYC